MEMKNVAKKLANEGRYGDTLLAHITPQEAAILRLLGGSGTINPKTGLPEFWGFGGFFSSVFSPITEAVSNVVEGIGGAIEDTASNVGSVVNQVTESPLLPLVANYFVPGSGAYIAAAQTLDQGGSLEDAIKTGAVVYGAQQLLSGSPDSTGINTGDVIPATPSQLEGLYPTGGVFTPPVIETPTPTPPQPAGSDLLSPDLANTVAETPVLDGGAQGLKIGGGTTGLELPTLPGLEAMGGAQGLNIPAAGGGTLGAGGVGLPAGGLMNTLNPLTGLPLGAALEGIETGVGSLASSAASVPLPTNPAENLAQRFLGNQLMATLFSPQTVGGLLTGAGGLIGGQQDVEARQQLAEQLRAAGQQAATSAQFRPVGITTRFGASQFQVNPQTGQLESAGYTVSPEFQALQNRLMGLAGTGLTQAEQAQAEFAPLTGAAQGLFGLGQQYLARSPQEVAQQYVERQQALLQPERERQLATIRNRLQKTGRTGLSVAQGGDLQAANPELAAYYNALAQQNLQLAAQGEQAGQQAAQFGAGLFGTGANILGQRYAGQQAALTPFTQYLTGVGGIESQALQPLALSSTLGQIASGAGARAGQLGLTGNLGAAQALYPANAYSPYANILGGLGQSSLASGLIGQGLGSLFGGVSDALTNANYFSQFGISPDVASIAI